MPPKRPRKTNGHRWRQLEARVLAEEDICALCDQPVDKTLDRTRDPMSAAIDHDIPIYRGGPEYDRQNCHLLHRACNRSKDTLTLAEARAKRSGLTTRAPIVASLDW